MEQSATFTAGRTLQEYEVDVFLRSATGRQFEIVGEALKQLASVDESTASRISEYARIIAFRNILIHVRRCRSRHRMGCLETKLPILRREVDLLRKEP